MLCQNIAKALIEQGRDNLQLTIDFSRRNGLEVFWSLRMNDMHDNWYPNFYPKYKKEHPEFLIFQPPDIGKPRLPFMEPHMNATVVNYGSPEVRERQFAILRDVCERYDIDGIELDFMRQPIYFRPTIEGRPVGPEELEIMTGFMSRVRSLTEEIGKKRGKPLLIACRVPSLIKYNKGIGLDIEKWAAEDLVDLMVPSLEYHPFTGRSNELANLGHRCQVPVYACLTPSGINSPEEWAGAAANVWNDGVDGIYLFNMFDPRAGILRTIGDPAILEKMDKVYAVDNTKGKTRTWEHVIPPKGHLPLELNSGSSRSVIIRVGDEPAGHTLPKTSLRIFVEQLTYEDKIEFKLNNNILSPEVVYATEGVSPVACGIFLLKADVEPSSIKKGDNHLEAFLKKRCQSATGYPIITGLQLQFSYRK